jgi:hypothetical protein
LGNEAIWDPEQSGPATATPPASSSDSRANDAAPDRMGVRRLLLVVCCLLVAVPFLSVRFPPVTDLPQHLAQVRLLHETIANPDGPYRIQWLTPYLLAYGPLALGWQISPSEAAGRIAMLCLALLWTLAIHGLAVKRARPAAAAVLATALFFNHDTYWGLVSFEMGWPAFALWFLLTTRPQAQQFRWRDAPLYLGSAALLYMSHALWLAAGVAWFLLRSAVARTPIRAAGPQLASFTPVIVMAAIWYPQLSANGFSSPTRWVTTPTGRLSVSWLVDAVLGGLQGPVEYVAMLALLGWVALAVRDHRGRLGAAVDRDLCLAGGFLLALSLLLPNLHQNTIAFASRWTPPAAILLLLGLPAPRWERTACNAAALAALAAFVVATEAAWLRFEHDEYSGLAESVEALPAHPRVIGLDYVKTSPVIKGRPFLQGFAYAQVARGGELNFSFAQFAPMAVVYRAPRQVAWTRGLEWTAEQARRSDFAHFDFALVNADDRQHAAFARALPELAPVTADGRWRLYRVAGGGR